MKPEQINHLAGLEEKLIDLFEVECTPDAWKKALKAPETEKEKKNALATLRLVGQIEHLLRDIVRQERPDPPEKQKGEAKDKERDGGAAIEREAADLTKRARKVLDKHGVKVH